MRAGLARNAQARAREGIERNLGVSVEGRDTGDISSLQTQTCLPYRRREKRRHGDTGPRRTDGERPSGRVVKSTTGGRRIQRRKEPLFPLEQHTNELGVSAAPERDAYSTAHRIKKTQIGISFQSRERNRGDKLEQFWCWRRKEEEGSAQIV